MKYSVEFISIHFSSTSTCGEKSVIENQLSDLKIQLDEILSILTDKSNYFPQTIDSCVEREKVINEEILIVLEIQKLILEKISLQNFDCNVSNINQNFENEDVSISVSTKLLANDM